MPEVTEEQLPQLLPPPPRPVTWTARLRSWGELPVRVWLIVTLALGAATAYVAVLRVNQALKDRWLIQYGTPVKAVFTAVGDNMVRKRVPRNEPLTVKIKYSTPSGQEIEQSVQLPAKQNAYAEMGTELPIRIDPNDPLRWTESDRVVPWLHELVTPLMFVPLVVLFAIIAFWRRQGILKIWANEPAAQAIVVDTQQSAIAPMSRIIRFTLLDDSRIWSLLMPNSAGIPQKGETIWVVCPPNNPGRAVSAKVYLDR